MEYYATAFQITFYSKKTLKLYHTLLRCELLAVLNCITELCSDDSCCVGRKTRERMCGPVPSISSGSERACPYGSTLALGSCTHSPSEQEPRTDMQSDRSREIRTWCVTHNLTHSCKKTFKRRTFHWQAMKKWKIISFQTSASEESLQGSSELNVASSANASGTGVLIHMRGLFAPLGMRHCEWIEN